MRYTKFTVLFVSLILLQLSVYAKDINKVQAGIAQTADPGADGHQNCEWRGYSY